MAKTASRAGASKLFTIRPYVPEDGPAVVTLAEATRAIDPGAPHLDGGRWRYVCADPYADPETTFRVAEDAKGAILGFGYRFDPPRTDGGSYRAVFVVVHPDHRRRGIGEALYEETLGDTSVSEQDPGWHVTTTIDERTSAAWPFAKRLGFKKAQTLLVLDRPLPGRPLPEADSDARIERFVGASAFQDWANIHNAAFAGAYGAIRHDADSLETHRPDGFRPEHLRFARLGHDRVGYLFVRETTSGGYIESIGVLPDARGNGIGTALLISALEYLVERGHQRCELTVDEGNSAALKMYARLGFDEVCRRMHLRHDGKPSRRRSRRTS